MTHTPSAATTPTKRLRTFSRRTLLGMTALVGSLGLFAAGCSSADSDDAAAAASSTVDASSISIVASTQAWADIAQLVDEDAKVSAIINGDETDPHSFEPTAADIAKAKDADIIIVGGGGYDAWLYSAVDQDNIIHALPLVTHDHDHDHGDHEGEAGHDHEHEHGHDHSHEGEVNEHVWFDIESVEAVATELSEKIKSIDPKAKTTPDAVAKKLDPIKEVLEAIPAAKVAQTEPIADYILENTKLTDVTPEGYREATMDEQEPSAADVAAFIDLINTGEKMVLIYNPQTETPVTQKIKKAAEDRGVPVVNISETPAKGENYFTFYADAAENLSQAVSTLLSE